YAFQWPRSDDGGISWTPVAAAIGPLYTLGVADEGSQVRLLITASNPDGTASAASAPTAAVPAAPPVNAAAPTIAGAVLRSSVLSAGQGAWNGIGNVYSLQWQRSADGSAWATIAGATGAAYTLGVADEGT